LGGKKISPEKEQSKNNKSNIALIKELLKPHKTIRMAVHKDIMVTHLETTIMDTLVFQRLRRLKQLGLTNLVFPSANHTRFEHSLGVLHVADKIVNKINKNPYGTFLIDDEDLFIIRLCGLIHDLGNLPFGHTIEDEGGLFGPQWSDERFTYFLGDNSEIGKIILNYPALKKSFSNLKKNRLNPANVLNELIETLKNIELGTPEKLERPYIADIVGNTLCADLLEYSKRDPYFTGLELTYDERILSYLYLGNYHKKKRLVLRLIKPKTKEIRRDILSELMDLLRLRYSLAEKVYYHHTKAIASAMLISSVNALVQEGKLSSEQLFQMDDEILLNFLSSSGNKTSMNLVNSLRKRKLYKIVYDLTYSEMGIAKTEALKKSDLIQQLRDPKNRRKKEQTLERMNSSSTTILDKPGSIIIYCPSQKMGKKELETLVDWGKEISPLKDIGDKRIQGEIKTSITDKHEELWRMYVLVDSEISDIDRTHINGDCEELFGLASASEKYKVANHTDYIDRHADKWHRENPDAPELLWTEVEEIKIRVPTRGDAPGETISYDDFCINLTNLRTPEVDGKKEIE